MMVVMMVLIGGGFHQTFYADAHIVRCLKVFGFLDFRENVGHGSL